MGRWFNYSVKFEGIYEIQRKIYGFDTFSGFSNVSKKDGVGHKVGDYSTDAGYEKELEQILEIMNQLVL